MKPHSNNPPQQVQVGGRLRNPVQSGKAKSCHESLARCCQVAMWHHDSGGHWCFQSSHPAIQFGIFGLDNTIVARNFQEQTYRSDCRKLESINATPSSSSFSRVEGSWSELDAWIELQTGFLHERSRSDFIWFDPFSVNMQAACKC